MKSVLAASLFLLGLASALPAPSDGPVRILPTNWAFEITSLKGPGCPDFGIPDGNDRHTRLTYGQNTVDGSEIYYWFIAYPSLRVDLGKTDSTWGGIEGEDYRLRLHKNGTKVISTYDIDSDVEATFSFKYLDADITDSYTIRGPAASGKYQSQIDMIGSQPGYREPKCGAAKLKFRTELQVSGSGKNGVVDSEHSTDKDGKVQYYGTQLGFSYDWEKCNE
ncbi:hypothetical protein GQX73_g903 [Xylaria multiplex]|uniref:Uncharacterized protein n=1 Tax=Xylaria multiplex TaxID=323545 RepID=A0A7C8ND50_9PEZI|nr:hypothetical protein GQX73_g903 [Xylaria multiplex]